jgi:hypothetical protein
VWITGHTSAKRKQPWQKMMPETSNAHADCGRFHGLGGEPVAIDGQHRIETDSSAGLELRVTQKDS